MRIDELSIFDERTLLKGPWNNPGEVRNWLQSQGFKEMGDGAFAEVFAHPGHNRIVKISTKQDTCWVKYAKFCLGNTSGNPHLPNISWIHQYGKAATGSNKFFISAMEKLKPIEGEHFINTMELTDLIKLARGLHASLDLFGEVEREIIDHTEYTLDKMSQPEREAVDKEVISDPTFSNNFFKTVDALEKIMGGCDFDLHMGNVMWRNKTQSIVITDPWVNYGEL